MVKTQSCDGAAVVSDLEVDFAVLDGFDFEDAEIGVVWHGEVGVGGVNIGEGLSAFILGWFFHAFDLQKGVCFDIFGDVKGVEYVGPFDSSN